MKIIQYSVKELFEDFAKLEKEFGKEVLAQFFGPPDFQGKVPAELRRRVYERVSYYHNNFLFVVEWKTQNCCKLEHLSYNEFFTQRFTGYRTGYNYSKIPDFKNIRDIKRVQQDQEWTPDGFTNTFISVPAFR